MEAKNSKIELLSKPFEDGWANHEGSWVAVQDTKTHGVYYGKIRLKAVRCGKEGCTRCPHHIYAYAQFRDGKKVREKYLGVAR